MYFHLIIHSIQNEERLWKFNNSFTKNEEHVLKLRYFILERLQLLNGKTQFSDQRKYGIYKI